MAKPDWGALQDQFLAEHAKTGISPKEWCEAQGLNYSTAKRYIKIANGNANSQKKVRIKLRIRKRRKAARPEVISPQRVIANRPILRVPRIRNRFVVRVPRRQ